jgi:hypothetical protein
MDYEKEQQVTRPYACSMCTQSSSRQRFAWRDALNFAGGLRKFWIFSAVPKGTVTVVIDRGN